MSSSTEMSTFGKVKNTLKWLSIYLGGVVGGITVNHVGTGRILSTTWQGGITALSLLGIVVFLYTVGGWAIQVLKYPGSVYTAFKKPTKTMYRGADKQLYYRYASGTPLYLLEPTSIKLDLKGRPVDGEHPTYSFRRMTEQSESALALRPVPTPCRFRPNFVVSIGVSSGESVTPVGTGWREGCWLFTARHVFEREGTPLKYMPSFTLYNDRMKVQVPLGDVKIVHLFTHYREFSANDIVAVRIPMRVWSVVGTRSLSGSNYSKSGVAHISVYGSPEGEFLSSRGELLHDPAVQARFGLIGHTASTAETFSGSPLLMQLQARTVVVGMHIAGAVHAQRDCNWAIGADAIARLRRKVGLVKQASIADFARHLVGLAPPSSESSEAHAQSEILDDEYNRFDDFKEYDFAARDEKAAERAELEAENQHMMENTGFEAKIDPGRRSLKTTSRRWADVSDSECPNYLATVIMILRLASLPLSTYAIWCYIENSPLDQGQPIPEFFITMLNDWVTDGLLETLSYRGELVYRESTQAYYHNDSNGVAVLNYRRTYGTHCVPGQRKDFPYYESSYITGGGVHSPDAYALGGYDSDEGEEFVPPVRPSRVNIPQGVFKRWASIRDPVFPPPRNHDWEAEKTWRSRTHCEDPLGALTQARAFEQRIERVRVSKYLVENPVEPEGDSNVCPCQIVPYTAEQTAEVVLREAGKPRSYAPPFNFVSLKEDRKPVQPSILEQRAPAGGPLERSIALPDGPVRSPGLESALTALLPPPLASLPAPPGLPPCLDGPSHFPAPLHLPCSLDASEYMLVPTTGDLLPMAVAPGSQPVALEDQRICSSQEGYEVVENTLPPSCLTDERANYALTQAECRPLIPRVPFTEAEAARFTEIIMKGDGSRLGEFKGVGLERLFNLPIFEQLGFKDYISANGALTLDEHERAEDDAVASFKNSKGERAARRVGSVYNSRPERYVPIREMSDEFRLALKKVPKATTERLGFPEMHRVRPDGTTEWCMPPSGAAAIQESLGSQLAKQTGGDWKALRARHGGSLRSKFEEFCEDYKKSDAFKPEEFSKHFEDYCKSVDGSKSSGFSSRYLCGDKSAWLKDENKGRLMSYAFMRLALRLSAGDEIHYLSTKDMIRYGLQDPREIFTKGEAHSSDKRATKRWRLIWVSSIVDSCCQDMLHHAQNKSDILNFSTNLASPSLVGLGHHDAGIREIGRHLEYVTQGECQVLDSDASGWDLSVPRDAIYFDAERRIHLLRGGAGRNPVAAELLLAEAACNSSHAFILKTGLYVLERFGVTASGIPSTGAQNSAIRAFTAWLCGAVRPKAAGDDLLSSGVLDLALLATTGCLTKGLPQYNNPDGPISFTSHLYTRDPETGEWSARFDNFAKLLAHLDLRRAPGCAPSQETIAGIMCPVRHCDEQLTVLKLICVEMGWEVPTHIPSSPDFSSL